jgi:hypothetical protein
MERDQQDADASTTWCNTGSASAVVVWQSATVLEFSALAAAIMTAEAKLI